MTGQVRRTARWPLALAPLAVAGAVMAGMLWYGGAVRQEPLPGLPDPGGATGWLLAVARLGSQLAAVVTVGLLVAAVVMSPRENGRLSPTGYRRLRAAGWASAAWCGSTLAVLCFTLADVLGVPISEAVSFAAVVDFATTVDLGRPLGLSALLAAVASLVCLLTMSVRGAAVGLLVAVAAVVPPLFAGHAAAASNHRLAVSSLLLHVIPVTVWAGGLLALLVTGRSTTAQLAVAVRRFSPLAAWCLAAVAVSGVLSAYARLPDLADLTGTRYGQLILVKMAALAALGAAGWAQRRAAIPALIAGRRSRFVVTATVEVLLFAAAIGTAVALSRTPTPTFDGIPDDPLLGFPSPPPMTLTSLATGWLVEPLYAAAALAAAGLYLAGVWRLRRRGDAWSVARTVAWLGGCAVIVLATSSGVARYAPLLFSIHMIQHLLLSTLAPLLLVLAAPVTLGRRSLAPAGDPAWPGPREWLLGALRAPVTRALSHPMAAAGLYVASLYGMYMTGLYELTLRSHAAHLAVVAVLVTSGYLFFWVVVGADPTPHPVAHSLRIAVLAVTATFQAFLGLMLTYASVVVAESWFTDLNRLWGPVPLDDQHAGGRITWSIGELPALLVLIALLIQMARTDDSETAEEVNMSTSRVRPGQG